jgi:hypothetical protein
MDTRKSAHLSSRRWPAQVFVWQGGMRGRDVESAPPNVADPNYSTPLPALDALGGHSMTKPLVV